MRRAKVDPVGSLFFVNSTETLAGSGNEHNRRYYPKLDRTPHPRQRPQPRYPVQDIRIMFTP